mgnify:CR=1 FL=1
MRLLHNWNCPWSDTTPPRSSYIGAYGELVAASWLRAQGYKILRRQLRLGTGGEVDIVCRKGDTLVFVEVKSALHTAAGRPARRVNAHKRGRLRQAAQLWLRRLEQRVPTRMDIIEVLLPGGSKPQVHHLAGAFPLHAARPAAGYQP